MCSILVRTNGTLVLVFQNIIVFEIRHRFFFSNQNIFSFLRILLHILLDLIIVFPMASSVVNSVTDRNIDQLLAFVDHTTAEVATLQNKFDQQEELADAFGGDASAVAIVAAHAKVDKLETRLIAAKARQEAAYNRYATTIESTNKTVVGASKASTSSSKAAAKVEDNKLLKRKLREPDEWKDHSGKNHVKNLQAFAACKSLSAILWKVRDGGIAEDTSKDVAFGELFTHSALMDRIDTMLFRETLDYALNMAHEQSVDSGVSTTPLQPRSCHGLYRGQALFGGPVSADPGKGGRGGEAGAKAYHSVEGGDCSWRS
jgi:hypothetical protein